MLSIYPPGVGVITNKILNINLERQSQMSTSLFSMVSQFMVIQATTKINLQLVYRIMG